MRNLMVGLLFVVLTPAACGDSSSDDDDDGNEAGAGGTSGEAGGDTGGSSTGGSATGGRSTGGRSGNSTGGRGGNTAGEGGEAGDGTTGGMGGEPGGDGGSGGEPSTGGGGMGGTAGVGGAGAGGGGGMTGGSAGAAGVGGAGVGGGGTGGSGGGVCTESPIRCALGTCPAGTSPAFYQASGAPVSIPDSDTANPAVLSIPITAAGLVSRLVVQTNITHPWDGDLDIFLETPASSRELSTDNGEEGDNYENTIFADSAMTEISAGSGPFAGTYRPEHEFASLLGISLAGTYRLSVADDGGGDIGELSSFTLGVCQCLASSGQCEFGLACLNGTDDDGDSLVDCDDPNCAASCPKPESACGDGTDNDGDSLVDCADPSCSWACTELSSCMSPNRIFSYATWNVPQAISTSGSVRLLAPIVVEAAGTIVSAAARFTASHTWVEDLTLTLGSPSGVSRILTSESGGGGDDYVNTVFIDSASCIIGTTECNEPPFTGSFRPEEPFSAWAGQPARGVWVGELLDAVNGDGGILTELSLALCMAP